MTYNNITCQIDAQVALITINRPSKLNALNSETISELHDAISSLQNNTSVKAIIITGSGQKAFVAGADISEFADFNYEQAKRLSHQGQSKLFSFIEQFSKPVIAAVNGFALGGGLELAMSCHFRVASNNARLGLPEVSLGVIPGYGGTQRLTHLVGKGKAMEMILTASMVTAEEGLEWGLLNYVVEPDNLLPFVESLCQKIIANSPKAIGFAIQAINACNDHDKDGYELEIENFGKCFETDDFKEGTSAFLEKRKANFKGN
ncbi:MAG: enoyl-CoA hydratase/isomerase family protein [Flavobacteriaceae bacterium]